MVDKLLTINLRNYLVKQPVRRRHMKISGYVRDRVAHYTKVDEENVKLTGELNILMIKRHAKSMLPLKVNVKIEDGKATVSPFVQAKKEEPAPAAAKPKAEAKSAPAKEQKSPAKTEAKKEAKPSAAASPVKK
jgi:hypothetical protein